MDDWDVTCCHEVLYRVVLWRLEGCIFLWFYVLSRGVRVYCARTCFWVEFTSRIKCTVSWVHLRLSICFAWLPSWCGSSPLPFIGSCLTGRDATWLTEWPALRRGEWLVFACRIPSEPGKYLLSPLFTYIVYRATRPYLHRFTCKRVVVYLFPAFFLLYHFTIVLLFPVMWMTNCTAD